MLKKLINNILEKMLTLPYLKDGNINKYDFGVINNVLIIKTIYNSV